VSPAAADTTRTPAFDRQIDRSIERTEPAVGWSWRRIGVPSMITRWRDCVRWNWQVFLAERESKQTQDWMAAQLTVMVEERKRREGECR